MQSTKLLPRYMDYPSVSYITQIFTRDVSKVIRYDRLLFLSRMPTEMPIRATASELKLPTYALYLKIFEQAKRLCFK